MRRATLVSLLLFIACISAAGQTPVKPSEKEMARVETLFATANSQLEKREYAAALSNYEAALAILPDDPSILYNAGFAALLGNKNETAVTLLARLKVIEPDDWQVRTKLIQAYQRLGKAADRDREREELSALRKRGKDKELNDQIEYCRDRFMVGDREAMAFELFEFKGPRAVRYIFRILDKSGKEDHRISLGSYDMTNAVWRETTKPTPKDGVRLFHLDGYFRSGAHATYGMFPGEPTYEETKKMVISVLENKSKPVSATIPSQ